MSKAIEELAKPIAKDFIVEHKGKINNDAPLTHECVQYTIERMFSVPLAQRLTDVEKESFRKMYKRIVVDVENSDSNDCIPASEMDCAMETLERIFGKNFFKEDKL